MIVYTLLDILSCLILYLLSLVLLILQFLLNGLEVVHIWPIDLEAMRPSKPLYLLLRSSEFVLIIC